jgi:hypothetical protein
VTLRNLAYFASVVAVCATALIEYLNFTGFCYRQGRYLGEQELVNFAIEQAIHFGDLVTTDVTGRQVYSSIEEFRRINPKCCILHKRGHPDLEEGIWVRIFGWYISVAEIWYRLSAQPSAEFFRAYVFMSACGEVKRVGGSTETIQPSESTNKGK